MIKSSRTLILLGFFLSLTFSTFIGKIQAGTDGINVKLGVNGCDNNGICEASNGEDVNSCPNDCTVIPLGTGSGSGGGGTFSINSSNFHDLVIDVSLTDATIEWKTAMPTLTVLKWGESTDYVSGTIGGYFFFRDHKAELINLKSNTRYYFSISGQNIYGTIIQPYVGTFVTSTPPDTTPPSKPKITNKIISADAIKLTWINPSDIDFDYVRLMRSEKSFPKTPFTGKLIYENKRQYFTDLNVTPVKKYYYSLFARDKTGNFSLGAEVFAQMEIKIVTCDLDPSLCADIPSLSPQTDNRNIPITFPTLKSYSYITVPSTMTASLSMLEIKINSFKIKIKGIISTLQSFFINKLNF